MPPELPGCPATLSRVLLPQTVISLFFGYVQLIEVCSLINRLTFKAHNRFSSGCKALCFCQLTHLDKCILDNVGLAWRRIHTAPCTASITSCNMPLEPFRLVPPELMAQSTCQDGELACILKLVGNSPSIAFECVRLLTCLGQRVLKHMDTLWWTLSTWGHQLSRGISLVLRFHVVILQ